MTIALIVNIGGAWHARAQYSKSPGLAHLYHIDINGPLSLTSLKRIYIMTNSIIIPSSEKDRKRIKTCMEEISNSYLRQEAERTFVKEAIDALADEIDIPKKYLSKMAKIFHKQNMSELVSELEDLEALIDTVST